MPVTLDRVPAGRLHWQDERGKLRRYQARWAGEATTKA